MIDSQAVLTDLQKEVTKLYGDLSPCGDSEPAVDAKRKATCDGESSLAVLQTPGARTLRTY